MRMRAGTAALAMTGRVNRMKNPAYVGTYKSLIYSGRILRSDLNRSFGSPAARLQATDGMIDQ